MKTMNNFKSTIVIPIRMAIGSILLLVTSFSSATFAQTSAQPTETVSMEKYTGYYQLSTKSDFVKFELRNDVLFATKLWDDTEYELVQINETTFETKEGGHKVQFMDESSDGYAQAKILEKYNAIKVAFNPQQAVHLSQEQLQRLEGTYTFTKDSKLKLEIRSSAQGLTLKQLWDNKEINFTPRAENFFLNDDGTFPLTFSLSDGKVAQLTCFENDIWLQE